MYRVPMVAPDAGTFPLGQMFSGDKEKQDGFNTFGKVNSSSQGNEVVSEQTTSISLRADTIYNATHPAILPSTVNRNTIMAMLEGSGIDDNGTYIEIIGTSGNRIVCPLQVTDAKYLFYKDGYSVIDGRKKDVTTGKPSTRKNPYIDKYNKTNLCTAMELAVAPTAEASDDVVFRFPFVSASNVQFAEGTDANNYTADAMFLSDRVHASQLLYDGFSANEIDTVATSGDTSISKVNADYIRVTRGGGVADLPTGVLGNVAIVIADLTGASVAVTSGVVTGTTTAFDTELSAGGAIVIDGTDYLISSVASATSLTLTEAVTITSTTEFNSGSAKVEIYKQDGTNWVTTAVTSTLDKGFVAWTNDYEVLTVGTSGEVGFITVSTAGLTKLAIAGIYGSSYIIPAKDAVTNVTDRLAFFANYTA